MKKIRTYHGEISRYTISKEVWINEYKDKNNCILVSDNGDNVVIDIIDYLTPIN